MAKITDPKRKDDTLELVTFHIGNALCGINILKVQEINKHMKMTVVPQSPEYMLGILNIRGRIVSILDLGKKLGISATKLSEWSRNVIVNSQDEHVGLLVDRISDVILTDLNRIEPPPANISGLQGRFFEGVFKTEDRLIGILDVEEVLKEEEL